MSAPTLFRFTVWHRTERGWDSAEIWASDHEDAVREANMKGYTGRTKCDADDWDRVQLPDGRELSRKEYESTQAMEAAE